MILANTLLQETWLSLTECCGRQDMNLRPRIADIAWTLLLILPLHAQVGGTISGTVKDVTEGVIGGATVEIVNIETGVGRNVVVNRSGAYSAPNLRPGSYRITASAPSF